MIKVTVDGTEYEFDRDRLMLKEALAIKSYTNLTVTEWQKGLQEFDPMAVAALVWLLKKRAGEDVRFSDVDCNLASFAAIDDEAEADPTAATAGSGTS